MQMPQKPPVEALLFDLGGVVFEFDFEHALQHWALHSALPLDELRQRFGFDEPYRRHERGEIAAADYFESLRRTLRLSASDEQIAHGWNAIFRAEITETLDAIQQARKHWPCYAFSNTNAEHQRAWTAAYPRIATTFDRVFVSSEIGLRKPEAAAFAHIAEAIGVAPSAILFFDDLAENVTGAIAAGLQAVQVRSPADVREALARL
ncbi:HAD family phosphatase [Variovorax sp. J22G21]|uniref:HAD family hydrolase n=1 Tax=Variovorax fucosicus TaxID=3053517 RepID=UPI0025762D0C|nr:MULTISPECIES: HAD family phosphatase [unclassified Variovorax]MDM0038902.1 HAD family phosphatase [Variovorax sp. J22R193]MDM0063678.1 HAD family phosphatase [Variovorax sp. J22G21]